MEWKTTSIYFKWKRTSFFLMEDDLNILVIGRQPPQLKRKLECNHKQINADLYSILTNSTSQLLPGNKTNTAKNILAQLKINLNLL